MTAPPTPLAAAYGAHAVALAEYRLASKAEGQAKRRATGWCKRGSAFNVSEPYRAYRAATKATGAAYDRALETLQDVQRARASETEKAGADPVDAVLQTTRAAEPKTHYSTGPALIPTCTARGYAIALGPAADIAAIRKSRKEYVYEASFPEDGPGPMEVRGRSAAKCLGEIHRHARIAHGSTGGPGSLNTGTPYTVIRTLARDYADDEAGDPGWEVFAAGYGGDMRRPFA